MCRPPTLHPYTSGPGCPAAQLGDSAHEIAHSPTTFPHPGCRCPHVSRPLTCFDLPWKAAVHAAHPGLAFLCRKREMKAMQPSPPQCIKLAYTTQLCRATRGRNSCAPCAGWCQRRAIKPMQAQCTACNGTACVAHDSNTNMLHDQAKPTQQPLLTRDWRTQQKRRD